MYDAMLYENDGESSKLLDFLLFCNGSGNPLPERKGNDSRLKTEPETNVESSETMVDNGNPNVESSTTTETVETSMYDATYF